MRHPCHALLVSCIDFRIQRAVEEWAREHFGEGNYDRVAWAGGVLKLDEIIGQIDISVRLHQIKKVALMNHEDCGAYGETGTLEKHRDDLRASRLTLHARYPKLTVETYFVKLSGEVETV